MIDLNDLVPADVTVTNATGINAAGQIVGDGRIGGSAHARALLLTPMSWTDSPMPWPTRPRPPATPPTAATRTTPRAGRSASRGRGWGSMMSRSTACRPGDRVCHRPWPSPPTARPPSPARSWAMTAPRRAVPSPRWGASTWPQQRMADSPFTILVVGNQSLPVNSAFVMSGGPCAGPGPDPAGSWTSVPGRSLTVTHNEAPGDYNVLLGTGNTPIERQVGHRHHGRRHPLQPRPGPSPAGCRCGATTGPVPPRTRASRWCRWPVAGRGGVSDSPGARSLLLPPHRACRSTPRAGRSRRPARRRATTPCTSPACRSSRGAPSTCR